MKTFFHISISVFVFLLLSCGNNLKNQVSLSISHEKKMQRGKPFTIAISSKDGIEIDSVVYFYAGKMITAGEKSTIQLNGPLGKHLLKAEIKTPQGNTSITREVVLHNDQVPEIYGYEVINTFPHDPAAFTQGLEFYDGKLYESIGKYGKSALRQIELKSGRVLKREKLPKQYFAEGLTLLNGKLYLLTWKSGEGFIYDPQTFKKQGTFTYNHSKEGWGLCNDGENLYKSDGTAKIWILNPKSLAEEGSIQPVTHKSLSTKLNELEWVDGKIYANTWHKDGVAIIDPKSGAIEGLIDFRGLKKRLGNTSTANVLNGVAYDAKHDKLYVTGKYWDKIFEVKIIKK